MDAFENKTWAGAVELDDGTTWYTCSVRCAFGAALKCEQFLAVSPQRIRRIRVPNYMHPEHSIDANTALYIIDSDVRGPMGLALVPAASREDADLIMQRHGGRVLQRADITLEVLMDLKKRSKAPQPRSS
jgi:copper chaperone NosL